MDNFGFPLGRASDAERYKLDPELDSDKRREMEQAPLVELVGFNRKTHREKLEKKYAHLPEEKRQAQISEKEKDIVLDEGQMKLFLKDLNDRLGNSGFRNFLEEYCIIELNTDKEEYDGAVTLKPGPKKISIEIDPMSFLEYGQTQYTDESGKLVRLRRFNPAKAAIQIGRAVGSLIEEPDNWKEVSSKVTIFTDRTGSWEDFVGFCIATPEEAKRQFPEAFDHFEKILRNLNYDAKNVKLRKPSKDEKIDEGKFALDLRTDEEKNNRFFNGIDNDSSLLRRFMFNVGNYFSRTAEIFKGHGLKRIHLALWQSTFAPFWKRTTWYQRAVAEFEDKETSRIVLQNEGIADRDRELLQLVGSGEGNISWEDKFKLRTLLMADMKFSDFAQWRIHTYLQACDEFYRKTKGEMITAESYNFIIRLHRNSQMKKRYGTKICEYELVEQGNKYTTLDPNTGKYVTKIAPERVYVRKNYAKYQEEMLEEIKSFSPRQILNIEKEVSEYMKVGGSFIDPRRDNYSKQLGGDNPYGSPTGKLDAFLGKGFADRLIGNYCNRGDINKLDVDQIGYLARIISEEAKARKNNDVGFFDQAPKKTFLYGAEHAPSHVIEAFENYKEVFLKDDRLRGYVNYYLSFSGLEIDRNGVLNLTKKGNTDPDQKTLQSFYEEKEKENKEEKEEVENEKKAEEIDNEYDNVPDEDVRSTLIKKGPNKAGDEIRTLEKALQAFNKDIANIIKSAVDLSPATREMILRVTQEEPNEYILEDLLAQYEEDFGEKPDIQVQRKMQSLEGRLRPLRIEQRNIKDLFYVMGIEPYLEHVKSKPEESLKKEALLEKSKQIDDLLLVIDKEKKVSDWDEAEKAVADLLPEGTFDELKSNPDNINKINESLSMANIAILSQVPSEKKKEEKPAKTPAPSEPEPEEEPSDE